jgi:predicted acetyltransferase
VTKKTMTSTAADGLRLAPPSLDMLPQYTTALERGWSPNNLRDVSGVQLAAIRDDPETFLRDLVDVNVAEVLPDGRKVPRLPFHAFWLWDGAFCGSASLRFQRGTDELPPYVSGHIGYAVVPWKRGRGYASRTLMLLLPIAREEGLRRVMLTCESDNEASKRIILKCGGRLAGEGPSPHATGKTQLTFWIETGAAQG